MLHKVHSSVQGQHRCLDLVHASTADDAELSCVQHELRCITCLYIACSLAAKLATWRCTMWVAYALLKLWCECDSKGCLHCNQCTEHTRQTTDCDWHINLSMTLQSGECEGYRRQHATTYHPANGL